MSGNVTLDRLSETMEVALRRLEEARPFAKARFQSQPLDVAVRMLGEEGGIERLAAMAPRLDAAGLFAGSDWDAPASLLPQLVGGALDSPSRSIFALEAVSLLRFLAVARGDARHPGLHQEHARHFLTQVLALNTRRFLGAVDEAARERPQAPAIDALFRYLASHVGFQDVLSALVEEIWRILAQRPIQVNTVKDMIAQIAVTLATRSGDIGGKRLGADRLVSALFGPTTACGDDPGLEAYRTRLGAMDDAALRHEAQGMARAMHDTGLVSDYHAELLVWSLGADRSWLVPEALGLTNAGLDGWLRHQDLVEDLIRAAVGPATPQAALGLAEFLERGVLNLAPVALALRRQLSLPLAPGSAERLAVVCPPGVSPEALLIAGALQVLGLPLGVGQGANPTCQAARAISMWSLNDPNYLLHLIGQVARHDAMLTYFEGRAINSAALPAGLAAGAPMDADPVSILLVPHLDRVYAEMGRLCADRPGDPHIWVNPEFHGWWVGRGCAVAVDVPTGGLADMEAFLRRFHAAYHPEHNGGQPLIHPQPAGIAITDPTGRFVGWHAIAILRVAPDAGKVMRVYFYNPNNDSGQDWGDGVVVSTRDHGERPGEASLPFEQFAARLYLFHDDPLRSSADARADPEAISRIAAAARATWAEGRAETV